MTVATAELLDYDEVIAKYEPVLGHGGARRTVDRDQDVLRVRQRVRRRTQHPGVPGVPRAAGLVAGAQPGRRRVGHPHRAGAELRHRAVGPVRQEELLLSGQPKNYQIIQYDEPIAINGYLDVPLDDGTTWRIEIERAHMEEDTGKLTHLGSETGRIEGATTSLHRLQPRRRAARRDRHQARSRAPGSGLPRSPARTSPRFEICCAPWGFPTSGWTRARCAAIRTCRSSRSVQTEFGTRTETKNVNSLKSVEVAVRYEMRRQAAVLKSGGRIIQETRHFHEDGLHHAGPEQGDRAGLPVLPGARSGTGRAKR